MHPQSIRSKRILCTCHICGTTFSRKPSEVGKYCSIRCSNRGTTLDVAARFWPKVNKHSGQFWNDTECWEWTAATAPAGYGSLRGADGKTAQTHRVSYELAYGPIQPGLDVLHHCDNPPCVRPEHLFLGTHADNMADMRDKRRGGRTRHPERFPRGERHFKAKLTEEQVQDIRRRYAAGEASTALAAEYGVRYETIWGIAVRRHWKHVP